MNAPITWGTPDMRTPYSPSMQERAWWGTRDIYCNPYQWQQPQATKYWAGAHRNPTTQTYTYNY